MSSAGIGAAPATASAPMPAGFISAEGVVPMLGMRFVGSELIMGAPGEFGGCDKTESAPNGYTIEWLSSGLPLPEERQEETLKLVPEDRGTFISFRVRPTTPEKQGCPDQVELRSKETAPIAASNRAMGWTGRGNFELLGRTASGELVLYPRTYTYQPGWCFSSGTCPGYTSEWDEPSVVGTGWGVFNIVFSPGDFDGDGNNDILARDAGGVLYLYPGDGDGGWLPRSVVGTGWNIFNTVLGPGDFNADGNNDVLGRDAAGRLLLYPGDGEGGWLPSVVAGNGWQIFDTIIAPGDVTGDGWVDLYGRDHAGYLHQYPTDGHLGWYPPTRLGPGWGAMSGISGAGSYTHNVELPVNGGVRQPRNDLLAINPDGELLRYFAGGAIGTGWDIFVELI
ncbi:VCBS repeat-containing protein [Arthrobacter sp. StoSoilB5]|uniref:FG-GAP repeat domain-containing protein n=1 Tax=Arthrobacter sp. StoSoilB5 TaxID=2830992 RepID=UPI001CC41445|nr:VCBS repeat-containing protein [Arthrobacter sp. StoSoilB5]